MPNPSSNRRVPASVPVYLASVQADIKRVQDLLPQGSPPWLYANSAAYAVALALAALEPYQGGPQA
jgi:hypothetical protein